MPLIGHCIVKAVSAAGKRPTESATLSLDTGPGVRCSSASASVRERYGSPLSIAHISLHLFT